jgi:hypothetical protein
VPDPLMPSAALLPLCDSPGGGRFALHHEPGSVRPYSATLGVVPVRLGKHDTTATKWDEQKTTETSADGQEDPDTVTIRHTDT